MQMKHSIFTVGLLVAGVTVIGALVRAQEGRLNPLDASGPSGIAQDAGPSVRLLLPENSPLALPNRAIGGWMIANSESQAISNALNKLNTAESDKERDAGNAELRAALVDQFDKDIARRKKELEAVATKLKEMQDLVAKRVESADKIIDLRIQVLLLDAKGLGWNSTPANDGTRTFGVQSNKLADPFK